MNFTNIFIAVIFLQFRKRYQLLALLAQFAIEMLITNLFIFRKKSLHAIACMQYISPRNGLHFQLNLYRNQGMSD